MEDKNKFYVLPDLPFGFDALKPYMSEEQLRLHHERHHLAYVNGANALLEGLDKARKDGSDADFGTIARQLSFNTGGHRLHSLFWRNLRPAEKSGKAQVPAGAIGDAIYKEFGSFERFKKEFSQIAIKTEGSGWAVLTYCPEIKRPIIMQVEKHNLNVTPKRPVIMALDVWEHAYYLDYKNDRARYVENFWNIVNWEEVDDRLKKVI